jgi:drug/metabolite transporter superfamily protein YnfA
MLEDQPLDTIPMWVLFVLTAISMLVAIEGGYRFKKYLKRKSPENADVGLGALAGASLALMAFLLAFVVGYGGTINTERRNLVVEDANAIGTTYLRAGYLDEPFRSDAKDLLREYTDIRVNELEPAELGAALARSEEIQNQLWADVETLARESDSPATSLYINTVNDVIDLHSERVAVGLIIRIPPSIILGLYLVALFATFLVGMQSGEGEQRNYVAHVVMVLTISVVFLLIIDLDRSREGFLQISNQPMIELQRQIQP